MSKSILVAGAFSAISLIGTTSMAVADVYVFNTKPNSGVVGNQPEPTLDVGMNFTVNSALI